jgi:hypothetical protein
MKRLPFQELEAFECEGRDSRKRPLPSSFPVLEARSSTCTTQRRRCDAKYKTRCNAYTSRLFNTTDRTDWAYEQTYEKKTYTQRASSKAPPPYSFPPLGCQPFASRIHPPLDGGPSIARINSHQPIAACSASSASPFRNERAQAPGAAECAGSGVFESEQRPFSSRVDRLRDLLLFCCFHMRAPPLLFPWACFSFCAIPSILSLQKSASLLDEHNAARICPLKITPQISSAAVKPAPPSLPMQTSHPAPVQAHAWQSFFCGRMVRWWVARVGARG